MLRNASEEYDRIDQESGHNEKNGDKQRISKELQFFLGGVFVSRRIDRQSGEKRPNDAWQVNASRQYGSHAHDSEHNDKIRVLVSFQLFQQVCTQAAQADQDEWNKDGDLDDLNGESRNGEPTVVGGSTDCEDDQGQGVRHESGAHRNHDWLKPGCPKSENDRHRQKGMRGE